MNGIGTDMSMSWRNNATASPSESESYMPDRQLQDSWRQAFYSTQKALQILAPPNTIPRTR